MSLVIASCPEGVRLCPDKRCALPARPCTHGLASASGVFSLSTGAVALVGEEALGCTVGLSEAEEGPAVASSGVIRRLRKRSMGVPWPCLTVPACNDGNYICI